MLRNLSRRPPWLIRIVVLIALTAPFMSSRSVGQSTGPGAAYRFTFDSQAAERIAQTLQGFVDGGTHAGISALVYQDGREVYFGAFGLADLEAGEPMTRDAIVQLYSMTKPIVGVALMTLYDEGRFDLDDPVALHAPEFADLRVYAGEDADGKPVLEPPHRDLTIRDLTRHTSGFVDDTSPPALRALWREADPENWGNTLSEFARRLGTVPLAFHPGEQWSYGPSVDVQAFLVERISGVPFEQYLREHVLDPLGMRETRYLVPEADRPRMAALYRTVENSRVRVPDEDAYRRNTQAWPFTAGSWGLTSTVNDYLRFAHMLVNEGELDGVRVLKAETVRLMATNHLADEVTKRSWLTSGQGQVGFGIDFAVRVRPAMTPGEKNGVVGEFFWDGAASTLFWVDPVNKLTAVLATQLLPYDSVGLHKAFRDAVYGPGLPVVIPALVEATIETSLGDIVIEVDPARAPVTASNFLRYVDSGRYTSARFHRAVRLDNQPADSIRIEVIQASRSRNQDLPDFGPIPMEGTGTTGLLHLDGTISMARSGPDTATSSFFICIGDQPELDEGGRRNPDGRGFAAFGRVIQGMDVVRQIQAGQTNGQSLIEPVVIHSIRRN